MQIPLTIFDIATQNKRITADQSDQTCLFCQPISGKAKTNCNLVYAFLAPAAHFLSSFDWFSSLSALVLNGQRLQLSIGFGFKMAYFFHGDNLLALLLVSVLTIVFVVLLGAQHGLKARVPSSKIFLCCWGVQKRPRVNLQSAPRNKVKRTTLLS